MPLPGYEMVMKCSHTFNLLDARGAISVTERAAYIGRVRALARAGGAGLLRFARGAGLPDAESRDGTTAGLTRRRRHRCWSSCSPRSCRRRRCMPLGDALRRASSRKGLARGRPSSPADARASRPTPRRGGSPCCVDRRARARSPSARSIAQGARRSTAASTPTASRRRRSLGFAQKQRRGRRCSSSACRDGKGEVFAVRKVAAGEPARDAPRARGRPAAARRSCRSRRCMRWGDGDAAVRAPGARPGDAARRATSCRARCSACAPGSTTRGHRFLGEAQIALAHADEYEAAARARRAR